MRFVLKIYQRKPQVKQSLPPIDLDYPLHPFAEQTKNVVYAFRQQKVTSAALRNS